MPDHFRRIMRGGTPNKIIESQPSELGSALTVNGRLESDGEIRVHGSVLGRISAERFFLGVDGYVEGDVSAKDVHIGGRINGRIFAPNVTVDKTAKIEGRIFHHTVTVAKGAFIDGRMPWRPLNFFEELDQLPEKQP